jgi:hypothetical protein
MDQMTLGCVIFFPALQKFSHRAEYCCQNYPRSTFPDMTATDVPGQLFCLISLDALDHIKPVFMALNSRVDSGRSLLDSPQLTQHFRD